MRTDSVVMNLTVTPGNESLNGTTLSSSRLTMPIATFTTGVIGNILAIFVIWRKQNRSDKKSVFYTLVMALATLDLTSTLVTSPVTFLAYHNLESLTDLGGSYLCHYSGFTMTFFGVASMALVFFMSIERLIAVRFALFYQTKITIARTRCIIVLIMAFFVLISALPLIGFGRIEQQYPGTWCFLDWKSKEPFHQTYNLMIAVMGLIMMLGTIFCNIYVVVRVVRNRRKMELRNKTIQILSKRKLRKMAYNEIQMIVLLAVMTTVFVLCYLPLLVRILINHIAATDSAENVETLTKWDGFAVWMASFNPVLDPWVYIFCRRSTLMRFFGLVKMTVTCKCSKEECGNVFRVGRDYKRRASVKSRTNTSPASSSKRALMSLTPTPSPAQSAQKYASVWRNKATTPNLTRLAETTALANSSKGCTSENGQIA